MMDWLAELLRRPSVDWRDLLDIALVSFLVYELLLLIRGTRAIQMALGGAFLIGLFFVSRWFELETVNWMIRNLATYVVFAIIVLFQADIRRALAHLGRAPSPRRRWRRAALARSSWSSGRSGCGTTSKEAFRSTR
jgi:DNA integrity scanning protein DisA with diadenylate cyclase activity